MNDGPPDPFPHDPEDHWPGVDPQQPLSETERSELLDDLEDLATFQKLLEPAGIRGLVVECPDCREPHYFDWGLLKNNLTHVLGDNSPRVHEPAYDPTPEDYVTWDYARGYTDCWQDIYGEEDSGEDLGEEPGEPKELSAQQPHEAAEQGRHVDLPIGQ